ncbi:hypothetical protein LCGC14_0782720 [marine sediment metagenome]|uniref:Uncharacterized protein n=1 Tax=marine sediment metagenome TaxID=412755 RepID=A0A0F9T221_9ZZZZ
MLLRKHTAARPDGTIFVSSESGTIERDTLQCVHCGRQWTVQPGSGKRRNFCSYHSGPTCGAPACDVCLKKDHGTQHGIENSAAYRRSQRQEQLKALHETLTKGGIVIP